MSIRWICCENGGRSPIQLRVNAICIDFDANSFKNSYMSTKATADETTQALSELRETIDRLIRGERDPEAMRKACERMDAMREDLRRRIGTVDIAVDLVRDARNP
jgi:hypothetical protein